MEPLALVAPFAPLIIVPLGLALAEVSPLTRKLQVPAALLAAGAFLFDQGIPAAALAAPWFLFTLFVAAQGLRRLHLRGLRPVTETAHDAALLYLAVGGFWLLASRSGARPLEFSDEIILLTAIHFHYAGFAACLFTALTGRALGDAARSPAYQVPAYSVVVAIPLLAAGIASSRWLEVVAACWLSLGVVAISGLALWAIRLAHPSPLASLCISAAAASTVVSMSLAAVYAAGEFLGEFWILIPQMALVHGLTNALGFAFCGLLGWWLARPTTR